MKARTARPGLSLGPVLYNWSPERWRDFHFRIADEAPVDSVYLGEVVCRKRAPLVAPHFGAVAERLERGGKQVVLSTLALVMDERDAAETRALAADGGRYVEANDMAAHAVLAGRRHAIGPFIGVYNEGTLASFAARGADRVSLPSELSADAVGVLARAAGAAVAIEVQAFGRLPLAVSARCYHARAWGRTKDGCLFACGEDADGMAVETLDGAPFLAVNGMQTLSHACYSLLAELPALAASGVRLFRLWPQTADMVAVTRLYRGVLDGARDPAAASGELGGLVAGMRLANGYHHGREGMAFVAEGG